MTNMKFWDNVMKSQDQSTLLVLTHIHISGPPVYKVTGHEHIYIYTHPCFEVHDIILCRYLLGASNPVTCT